jgi:hypothetical protein
MILNDFGPSDQEFDWMADPLAEGSMGLGSAPRTNLVVVDMFVSV